MFDEQRARGLDELPFDLHCEEAVRAGWIDERLEMLVHDFPIVALGSSGEWPNPGTKKWWQRMNAAMGVACHENGRPKAKLHGLRMLDRSIFSQLPFSSADSTNVARNYAMKGLGHVGAEMIAYKIENTQSLDRWNGIAGNIEFQWEIENVY